MFFLMSSMVVCPFESGTTRSMTASANDLAEMYEGRLLSWLHLRPESGAGVISGRRPVFVVSPSVSFRLESWPATP